jgi:hypothetical protein
MIVTFFELFSCTNDVSHGSSHVHACFATFYRPLRSARAWRETGQGRKGDDEELSSLEERLLELMGVQSFEGVYFRNKY